MAAPIFARYFFTPVERAAEMPQRISLKNGIIELWNQLATPRNLACKQKNLPTDGRWLPVMTTFLSRKCIHLHTYFLLVSVKRGHTDLAEQEYLPLLINLKVLLWIKCLEENQLRHHKQSNHSWYPGRLYFHSTPGLDRTAISRWNCGGITSFQYRREMQYHLLADATHNRQSSNRCQ